MATKHAMSSSATATPTRCAPKNTTRSRSGITGVPFFVIDRKYGVSGAQASSVLVDVLENAWREAHPLVMTVGGEACEGDSCAI